MCLAKGHNAVTPVTLEPAASRSRVKNSTTEPLRWHIKGKRVKYKSNMLQTLNSFAKSDIGAVIDSEPHPSLTCKTSLIFVPLAVRNKAGCSAFPFYTPTLLLIRLYSK